MKNIVIATTHSWNIRNAEKLRDSFADYNIAIICQKKELTTTFLENIKPIYIFFPHWSWIIPASIYENYQCVVFHMTDLPYGRGGSPLQNLISRGAEETQISAIAVTEGLDAGDVYLKEPLSLFGGAEEIYMRASNIIFSKMIPIILNNNLIPAPQSGKVTKFKRRTPEMSELSPDMSILQLFDYIRMLDAEDYPKAFVKFGGYTLQFSRPKITSTGIIADVEIKEVT